MQEKRRANSLGLNLTSIIVGLLLGISLTLSIAATIDQQDPPGGPGPYMCCAAGGDDLAVFVIDTQTGQTWRLSRTDHIDFGTPGERKSLRKSITPMLEIP